jgi:hypothetical protein
MQPIGVASSRKGEYVTLIEDGVARNKATLNRHFLDLLL